jgi:hypothetical protein
MTRSMHGSLRHSTARPHRPTVADRPPAPLVIDLSEEYEAPITARPGSAMRVKSSLALHDLADEDDDLTRVDVSPVVPMLLLVPAVPAAPAETAAPEATPAGTRLLDELGDDDLNLTVSLLCLEQAAGSMPRDPSARAAAETLRMRIQDLVDLRDALHALVAHARDASIAHLFAPEEPLAVYVKGLYVWSAGVVDTLDELARALRELSPDWMRLRNRLDEASGFYFDGLVTKVRRQASAQHVHGRTTDATRALCDSLEEVFWAASWLHRSLETRFG